jgi:hypothetical protein
MMGRGSSSYSSRLTISIWNCAVQIEPLMCEDDEEITIFQSHQAHWMTCILESVEVTPDTTVGQTGYGRYRVRNLVGCAQQSSTNRQALKPPGHTLGEAHQGFHRRATE